MFHNGEKKHEIIYSNMYHNGEKNHDSLVISGPLDWKPKINGASHQPNSRIHLQQLDT